MFEEGTFEIKRTKMTNDELLFRLKVIKEQQDKLTKTGYGDIEMDHVEADELLLKYINDKEVTAMFESIHKWYA